jgi:hypothetical protein
MPIKGFAERQIAGANGVGKGMNRIVDGAFLFENQAVYKILRCAFQLFIIP